MRLASGSTLGHYEITGAIGAGGMGEVYRAVDTRLDRDVAIKVLPNAVAQDADRLARFDREAHVLASLNHPNIATLHGFETEGDTLFLVMELVEGETFAERIARGAIPVDEALPLFLQIAEGLEAAHEKGVIHRDLKPANIKITEDGRVKILDFGLAKAMEPEVPARDLSHSPTLTAAATRRGEILGTAAYMSPEQARGKAVDQRTDLWAFGCCLYEALSSRSAFGGETASDTLAHILEREPDWEALPSCTPPSVLKMLRRCLEKATCDRLHHAGDARLELRDALTEGEVPSRGRAPSSLWTRSAALVGLAVAGLLVVLVLPSLDPVSTEVRRPTRRYTVPLEPAYVGGGGNLAVSPDGRYICYLGSPWALWIKDLETGATRRLEGTDNAIRQFFSPDGEWVGFSFYPGFQLFRVAVEGGAPLPIDGAEDVQGATWSPNGTIVYSRYRREALEEQGLYEIPEGGGTPRRLTAPDRERGDVRHLWPALLPSGDIVFSVSIKGKSEPSLALLSRKSGEWKVILDAGDYPSYAPTGHLVYHRSGSLVAAALDPVTEVIGKRPTGLIDAVHYDETLGDAAFAFSHEGLLVYSSFGAGVLELPGRLVWVDLEGNSEDLGFPHGSFGPPALSPDGKHLAVASDGQLWIYDLERRSRQRLSIPSEAEATGVTQWSADSAELFFNLFVGGGWSHYSSKIDGSAPTELVGDGPFRAISPDRKWLVSGEYGARVVGSADNRSPPRPLVEQGWVPRVSLSPNAQWLAYDYAYDIGGLEEVFVTPFPEADLKLQVSTDGGWDPVFSRDGRRIFYRRSNRLLAVDFEPGPPPRVGTPEVLFSANLAVFLGMRGYDVTPDGRRFLAIELTEPTQVDELHVVENWFEELKRLVPTED